MSTDRTIPELAAAAPLAPPADLEARLAALGVSLDATAIDMLARYFAALLAMNEEMNLTAVEPAQVWEKHGLDALSIVPHLPGKARTLIDIGSGGGVPGVVLAIARPDLRVTLLEATQKKASFLSAVARELSLANVDVVSERAEVAAKGALAARFDVVTARAVARLEKLLPLTAPFARVGGLLLLVKGARADEELSEAARALKKLGLRHEGTTLTPTGRVVALRK
jgi:16S rRNA (guanine527-N7)-methyltransferase